jgi:hypothetical protein
MMDHFAASLGKLPLNVPCLGCRAAVGGREARGEGGTDRNRLQATFHHPFSREVAMFKTILRRSRVGRWLVAAVGLLSLAIVILGRANLQAQEGLADPVPNQETQPPLVNLDIYRLDGTRILEDTEEDPGIAFLWNADNDDGGTALDKDMPDNAEYQYEDDLHKITLTIDASLTTGTIKLEMIGHGAAYGSVKVWTNATKKTAVPLPKTWTLGQDTVPSELWVEGFEGSQTLRDVELKLSHVQQNISDSVRITVVPLIPVMVTVEQSSDILKGAAWKPDGSYCLMAGKMPAPFTNGRVGRYSYPNVSPTILEPGEQTSFHESAWKPDGAFALIGGSYCILKYDGNVFTKIYDPNDRVFWDIKWKPRGGFAFVPAEHPANPNPNPGHAYKSDGDGTNNPVDLLLPNTPDATNADWRPSPNDDDVYVLCNGDTGCQWKWTDAGGPLGAWNYVSGPEVVQGSLVIAFHPSGAYALVGCTAGRVYKYSHATGKYTDIRHGIDTANTAGICWRPQGNYAILAGSRQLNSPYGRHVLLYNHGDAKFYDVDVHTDEKPFRRLAWHPSENFAVGAVHNYMW